ncbi:MAG TPA: aromatic-ring-hydroxylating dioxygenase subunit beta [Candidatus Limnocylindria bacterium]|nr:aromatic-ring-hydroxylating dioxygenase subunit beta [Candidatus Limnocylindria bacterium]
MTDRASRMELHWEVTSFFTQEARLLDERRFADWLGLLTEDARYEVRVRSFQRTQRRLYSEVPAEQILPLIDEDRLGLEARVRQVATSLANAENPPSRTRHLVTNVEVVDGAADELRVRSSFLVHRSRLAGEHELFVGERLDTLRRVGTTLRIARREIVLERDVESGRMCPLL